MLDTGAATVNEALGLLLGADSRWGNKAELLDVIDAARKATIQGAVRAQGSSLMVRESVCEEVSWGLQDEKGGFGHREEQGFFQADGRNRAVHRSGGDGYVRAARGGVAEKGGEKTWVTLQTR